MNKYELTVVLSGKASASKKKQIGEKIEKLVSAGKGKIIKSEDWGEIEFAGKIAKEKYGNYLFYGLELDGSAAKQITSKLRLDDDILRSLLVKVE